VPFKEALFWFGITLFGTGLFFVVENAHILLSASLIAIGLIGLVYSVYTHHYKTPKTAPLWVGLLIITWIAIAYDVYDRQSNRGGSPTSWVPWAAVCAVALITAAFGYWGRRPAAAPQPRQADPPSPPPLSATTPATAHATEVDEERIFIDVNPEYLGGFFKQYTDMQAQRLFNPFIGKWIEKSGTLGEVNLVKHTDLIQVLFQEQADTNLIMFFSVKWADHLSVLRRGDPLTVAGRIGSGKANAVVLDDCELVRHAPDTL